jgi:alcohol dehydrogenase class IV
MSRPLLVTDRGLATMPFIKVAVERNETAGLPTGLFAEVQGNPVIRNVEDGVVAFREGNHDGVIAFGGGSALDVGKIIALMSGQTRPLLDFVDEGDNWTRVKADGVAPIVAVPTTAGTGSEVGRAGVVTDPESERKRLIFHPLMMPRIVISDPELTIGLPGNITAWVGMDALSHCLEAYCRPLFHPMADGIALEGMRVIAEWLPRAVDNGADINARGHMLVAASMGATAFQKGLGAMHAMSHPCSARRNSHHGLTNAVVMPYVLAFNRLAVADKMAVLARLLDLDDASFDGVLKWVLTLRERIGIPHSLGEIGILEADIEAFVPDAVADPLTPENPIAIDADGYRELYRQAINGDLPA